MARKFSRIVATETILGLFAKDRELSRRLFEQYMNEAGEEHFLDLGEDAVKYTSESALDLFRTMVIEYGMDFNTYQKEQLPPPLIRELKHKTCWSLREIADLTGLNKDQVHRMVH